jgi:hypothetical protein
MMGSLQAWSAAALLLALALLAWPAPALAHGGDTTSAQTYVQSLGEHEVELTIQPTRRVPGPLLVELRFYGAAPEQVLLRPAPQAAWPDDTNMARVRPIAGDSGPYVVQLHVDRAGPWELQLASLHGEKALVPFTVRAPALDPGELGRSAAFAGAAGLVLAGGALGTLARRRPIAGWLIWPIGLGAMVCLTVGLTLAVQQSLTPPPQPAAARPHVNCLRYAQARECHAHWRKPCAATVRRWYLFCSSPSRCSRPPPVPRPALTAGPAITPTSIASRPMSPPPWPSGAFPARRLRSSTTAR